MAATQVRPTRMLVSSSGLSIMTSCPQSTTHVFHDGSLRIFSRVVANPAKFFARIYAFRGILWYAPVSFIFSVKQAVDCGVILLSTHARSASLTANLAAGI